MIRGELVGRASRVDGEGDVAHLTGEMNYGRQRKKFNARMEVKFYFRGGNLQGTFVITDVDNPNNNLTAQFEQNEPFNVRYQLETLNGAFRGELPPYMVNNFRIKTTPWANDASDWKFNF